MKTSTCLFILLFSCMTANAQWDGFPLADKTNTTTYYTVGPDFGVISQLWWAVAERLDVCQSERNVVQVGLPSFDVFAGYSSKVYTVTNHFPSFSVTNTFTNTIVVTELANGGVNTRVVYTSSLGVVTTNQPPVDPYFFYYGQLIYPLLYYYDDDEEEFTSLTQFVITNLSSTGDAKYDEWFGRTNAAGANPTNLPVHDSVSLYYYQDVGWYTNYTNTGWGRIGFVNDSPGRNQGKNLALLTHEYGPTNMLMAEFVFSPTGTNQSAEWTFREVQEVHYRSSGPVYTETNSGWQVWMSCESPSNEPASGSVKVFGQAFAPTNWIFESLQITTSAAATVAISTSAPVAIPIQFKSITNCQPVTASVPTNSFLHFRVTNSVKTYAGLEVVPHRLYRDMLDELYYLFDALRWIQDEANAVNSTNVSPDYFYGEATWTGYGWEAAYTNRELVEEYLLATEFPGEYLDSAPNTESVSIVPPSEEYDIDRIFGVLSRASTTVSSISRPGWDYRFWYDSSADMVVSNGHTNAATVSYTVEGEEKTYNSGTISVPPESIVTHPWSLSNEFYSFTATGATHILDANPKWDITVGYNAPDMSVNVENWSVTATKTRPYIEAYRQCAAIRSIEYEPWGVRYLNNDRTNLASARDLYAQGTNPPVDIQSFFVWDCTNNMIPNMTTTQKHYVATLGTNKNKHVYYGRTSFDTNTPPFYNEYGQKGYWIRDALFLRRWDVENGFRFVD